MKKFALLIVIMLIAISLIACEGGTYKITLEKVEEVKKNEFNALKDEKEDGMTIIVLGGGLSKEDQEKTIQEFDVPKGKKVMVAYMNKEDYERIFPGKTAKQSSLISSVAITLAKDQDLHVAIQTLDNITSVETHQYKNAAITSGMDDAIIQVVAVRPVSGESALAGVFLAAELFGVELDQDKIEVSNQELDVTTDISKNLEKKETEKLSVFILDVKTDVAKAVEEKGKENIQPNDITIIINNNIEKHEIKLDQGAIQKITTVINNYKNTLSKEDAQNFIESAKKVGETLLENSGKALEKLRDEGFFEKLWNGIKGIFGQ